jgi:hypothetical protein
VLQIYGPTLNELAPQRISNLGANTSKLLFLGNHWGQFLQLVVANKK